MSEEEHKCPRCGGKGVELGMPTIKVGRTRGIRVRVFECANCKLIFYEKAD
ncbi:MAG: hypothetical protein ACTSXJ_06510 [Candidatus Baldrarchaeia archaeon]